MRNHRASIFISILLIITGIVAAIHLGTREEVPESTIEVVCGEEKNIVDITTLDYEQVTGTRINGKGEEIEIDAPGVYFGSFLEKAGFTEYEVVSVVADDGYSAELTAVEIADGIEVYLIQEEGETRLRLVVLGEKDSKRSVSNVTQVIVK